MTCTSDSLGRVWSHDKLDEILADPAVERAVLAAEHIGGDASGQFDRRRVAVWAKRQGRSQPGLALLLLLCWRSACRRREEGRP